MAYGTKKKNKAKEMKGKECSACGDTQHNVPKSIQENKKIKTLFPKNQLIFQMF